MVIYLLLMIITGFISIYSLKNKINLSDILFYSLPIGIVIHTIIFLLLALVNTYYYNYLIVLVVVLFIIFFLIQFFIKKKKVIIYNDLKDIPLFFIIFIIYIGLKLVLFAGTSFLNYYNDDEFRAWLTMPKTVSIEKDFKSVSKNNWNSNGTIMLTNAAMLYEFSEITVQKPRVIVSILSIIFIFGLYTTMIKNNVNKTISGLLTILFVTSNMTFLNFARGYSPNPMFMCYFVISIFNIIQSYLKDTKVNFLDIIMIIGSMMIRGETMYLLIGLFGLLFLSVSKKTFKKNLNFPIICILMGIFIKHIYRIVPTSVGSPIPYMYRLKRLVSKDMLSNVSTKLVELFNPFESNNYTLFYLFIVIIFIFLAKKLNKYNSRLFRTVILVELGYFGIIFLTQLFLFNDKEFAVAASFTRYNMMLMPLNYILLGIFIQDKNKE